MDTKPSNLPPAVAAADADIYIATQAGRTRKQTLVQLRAAIGVSAPNTVAFAALSGSADRFAYWTSPTTMTLAAFTAYTRTFLESIDAAAARIPH